MATYSERRKEYQRERMRRIRAAMTPEERRAARHRPSDLADQARRRERRKQAWVDTLHELGFEINSDGTLTRTDPEG